MSEKRPIYGRNTINSDNERRILLNRCNELFETFIGHASNGDLDAGALCVRIISAHWRIAQNALPPIEAAGIVDDLRDRRDKRRASASGT